MRKYIAYIEGAIKAFEELGYARAPENEKKINEILDKLIEATENNENSVIVHISRIRKPSENYEYEEVINKLLEKKYRVNKLSEELDKRDLFRVEVPLILK